MSAPPPPPSSLQNPGGYSSLLKEYEDKANAVNMQASDKRKELTKDRVDLVRQQVEIDEQIQACNSKMTAAETKGKGSSLRGRGDEPYLLKRQKLELQNKQGWIEGRIQRIDDQILRVATDLATAIDRLEKERNQRIEYMNEQDMDMESEM